MSTPETRLASRLSEIEEALQAALDEAAGEGMAYILVVTPTARKGEVFMTSNIVGTPIIVHFLRDTINNLLRDARKMQDRFADRKKKGLN